PYRYQPLIRKDLSYIGIDLENHHIRSILFRDRFNSKDYQSNRDWPQVLNILQAKTTVQIKPFLADLIGGSILDVGAGDCISANELKKKYDIRFFDIISLTPQINKNVDYQYIGDIANLTPDTMVRLYNFIYCCYGALQHYSSEQAHIEDLLLILINGLKSPGLFSGHVKCFITNEYQLYRMAKACQIKGWQAGFKRRDLETAFFWALKNSSQPLTTEELKNVNLTGQFSFWNRR
ncbi:MAG: hypothetical protein ABIH39_01645, partial [Candidatus Margulisiibacteriota bacterium]